MTAPSIATARRPKRARSSSGRASAPPATGAALYIRVSTEEQAREGVSLDAQEARLRAYAALQGFGHVQVYRDEGVSASKPLSERPAGAALLAALAEGTVGHVVALKLDRLFRDTVDCLGTVRQWDRTGIAMHLVDLGGQSVHTGSALGRFFLTAMAGIAELERNLISERTSAALRHKIGKGERVGGPPFGYAAIGDGTGWVPVPEEQRVIAQILCMSMEGVTYAAIADRMNAEGRSTKSRAGRWHATSVRRVILRRLGEAT